MGKLYDSDAPKRPVNMTLNEDLVRCAREYASNLSEQVEKLLVEYVTAERKRRAYRIGSERRLDPFSRRERVILSMVARYLYTKGPADDGVEPAAK